MNVAVAYNACIGSLSYRFKGLNIASSYGKNLDRKIIEDADLLILTGGEDINPEIYGMQNLYSHGVNPDRDSKEIEALQISLALGKHVLGICRGHQLINAYLGGMLAQDLIRHLNVPQHSSYHMLMEIEKGIVSDNFDVVNSMHHQGVILPGRGLSPTTYHGGVIESCEGENIITVQFHPEFMDGDDVDNFFNVVEEWVNG